MLPQPTSSSIHHRQSRIVQREDENGRDPVDVFVGDRLRARRQARGFSQRKLGEKLGVSFQQIQKYERGTNRISVAALVRAAAALNTPMSFFFEGIGPHIEVLDQPALQGRTAVVERSLAQIEDRKVRAALRTLLRALAKT